MRHSSACAARVCGVLPACTAGVCVDGDRCGQQAGQPCAQRQRPKALADWLCTSLWLCAGPCPDRVLAGMLQAAVGWGARIASHWAQLVEVAALVADAAVQQPGGKVAAVGCCDQERRSWCMALGSQEWGEVKGAASAAYDVVVLGGTLGILLATALLAQHQQQATPGAAPLRVAVVERGKLQGRQQEWNASQHDLQVLVDLGLLQPSEVEAAVASRFSSVRVGVAGRAELTLAGVMDCGVCPQTLLRLLARRFRSLGGVVLEDTAFSWLDVYDDAALLTLNTAQQQQQQQQQGQAQAAPQPPAAHDSGAAGGAGGRGAAFESTAAAARPAGSAGPAVLSAGLVLDALGGFSPLSAQARDAACRGHRRTAASSSSSSSSADVLWGWTPLDRSACQQYWWERFPAAGGAATTSYMFAFTDPHPANARLLQHMAAVYAAQLPTYLGVPPGSLRVERGVFGVVPCYSSRVPPLVDRLLPVGDAAANRSALSLAGFCALLRHLPRLTAGILEAVAAGAISKQELGLLQPWCPGVAASVAMQRTMSVYSCQRDAIRSSSSSSSSSPQPPDLASAVAAANPSSSSSRGGAVTGAEVLDMMGSSFAAMWGAVGAGGMAPFVADRLQWGPLAAGMAAQLRADAPQLVSYSRFLNDGRGAPRLLAGLAGLAGYSLLHAATPLTGPLHEALLSRLSPRLLYAWHRYTDAWRYGSGADWDPAAPSLAAAAAAAAADSGASTSSPQADSGSAAGRDAPHSVDGCEDSPPTPGGYEGADADDALCRPDSPLCEDPVHSVDGPGAEEDWGLEAAQGWGQPSGSSSRAGIAAACGGSSCSAGASSRAPAWGGSMRGSPAVPAASRSSRSGKVASVSAVAVAAAGANRSSSSDGGGSGGDKNAELHRQQRRALEQLLLSIVVHGETGRQRGPGGASSAAVGTARPGAGVEVASYEGADAVRLLYPQLDPARSYDEYDVIDWSDVANDGWGSSTSSSSDGGTRSRCSGNRPASSSGSSSGRRPWGGSMCRAGWLPTLARSRQQLRAVAAARLLLVVVGAGLVLTGEARHGWQQLLVSAAVILTVPSLSSGAMHSVDTYEDSLVPAGSYEGADDALCHPHSPLCDDPMHSIDSTEVIDWAQQGSSSRAAVPPAAAANISGGGAAAGVPAEGTCEDAFAAPGGYEGADADDALCRPDNPLCEDPVHSVDGPDAEEGWAQDTTTTAASSSSSVSAAAAGTASPKEPSSSLSANHSYRKKHTAEADGQLQQQQQRRPSLNIVNGRWVPPSRAESEAMMAASIDWAPTRGCEPRRVTWAGVAAARRRGRGGRWRHRPGTAHLW
ncbi:hypothetical protein COO60DRAFT_1700692 [Scenedesmus sp. NREL 46B-D3]|nr:hypothetical protein COO60DRAFT_1700692 [Scenedesmus sp. NREL 46B-D3]